ncbi:MAG: DUF2868 domain-containing protein [Aliidiomarina sp.]|uniref:DUF2868 domain-containing protein n=1 Tax=Aliidiomarina sp. TaxID=1872439 RepID=UPI0025C18836|nr:DUF2868 domain-containing protein [Aliidiomarina sp.]MCH8500395.1 DUF2868 domain-containing protein [Aliidiomarina sp.]
MTKASSLRQSLLHKLWLIEHIRRQDVHQQADDDHMIVTELREQKLTMPEKIAVRAESLAESRGVASRIQRTAGVFRVIPEILVILAYFSAVALIHGATYFAGVEINILSLLLSLLLLNFLMLAIWLVSAVARPAEARGIGQRGLAILHWIQQFREQKSVRDSTLQSRFAVLQQQRLLTPYFSMLTHWFWSMTLILAWVLLWLRLAFESHQFVWATTILSDDTVLSVLRVFTWATDLIGMQAPMFSAESEGTLFMQQQTGWWVLAVLALFGVVPRVVLWLVFLIVYRLRLRAAQVDLSLPGISSLITRLEKPTQHIIDPEPAEISRPNRHKAAVIGLDYLVFSLDYEHVPQWNDVFLLNNRGVIATYEERQTLISELEQKPARKILVRVDSEITPDRGSLRFLAELQNYCNDIAVWTVRNGKYQTQWQELLAEYHIIGFSFSDEAIRWLGEAA